MKILDNQGIELAQQTQMNSNRFHSPMKIDSNSSMSNIDPKCLTNTQLQLCKKDIR